MIEDGHAAFGDLPDQSQRAVDLARIEAGIDLVQHQHLRPHRHALGQFEALAAGQRQRRRRPVGKLRQPHELELLAGNRPWRRQRSAARRRTARRPRRFPAPSFAGTAARSGRCGRVPAAPPRRAAAPSHPRPEIGCGRTTAGCTPVIRLTSVVLPAPFGPIRATISPFVEREAQVVDGLDAAEVPAEPFRHQDRRAHAAAFGRRTALRDAPTTSR